MTNEEKAVELTEKYGIDFPEAHASAYPLCYKVAMEMAAWKQEEIIEKVKQFLRDNTMFGNHPAVFEEFIKSLTQYMED